MPKYKDLSKVKITKKNIGKTAKSSKNCLKVVLIGIVKGIGLLATKLEPHAKKLLLEIAKGLRWLAKRLFELLKNLLKKSLELLIAYLKYTFRLMLKCSNIVLRVLLKLCVLLLRLFGACSTNLVERLIRSCLNSSCCSCLTCCCPVYAHSLNEKYDKSKKGTNETDINKKEKKVADQDLVMFKKTNENESSVSIPSLQRQISKPKIKFSSKSKQDLLMAPSKSTSNLNEENSSNENVSKASSSKNVASVVPKTLNNLRNDQDSEEETELDSETETEEDEYGNDDKNASNSSTMIKSQSCNLKQQKQVLTVQNSLKQSKSSNFNSTTKHKK